MTGIWMDTGNGWELAGSKPFPDESDLHSLVAENPGLLPLETGPESPDLEVELRQ